MDTRADGRPIGREILAVATEPGDDRRTLAGLHLDAEGADGMSGHRGDLHTRNDLGFRFEFGEIDIFDEIFVVAVVQGVGISAESNFIKYTSMPLKQQSVQL